MAKFVSINDYYVGAKINCIYYFMQIETLSENYQLDNKEELLELFNKENIENQIELCNSLGEDFLLYQDKNDLTELKMELAEKYDSIHIIER